MATRAVKKTNSLRPELARELEDQARAERKTLNGVIQEALWRARRGRPRRQFRQYAELLEPQGQGEGILFERDLTMFPPARGDPYKGQGPYQGRQTRAQRALNLLVTECNRGVTVGGIAGRLGLSASRLSHVLKAETGYAFRAWRQEIRLLTAEALLADGSLRVKEVASLTGYPSVPSFSREFKTRFGKPPASARSGWLG